MVKTAAFHTLGCKVNQYDTQAMRERFEQAGYTVVPFGGQADIYVINTCTVTGTGDKKSMQLIRRCARNNAQAQIVVAGCLAQRASESLRLPGVRLIIGTQRRAEVVTLLEQAIASDKTLIAVDSLRDAPFESLNISTHGDHTRATMKIQEGCDRYCAYCIIPSVRGPIRSRPLDEIESEAARLAQAGFCEVVLTGIHLTSYGRDLGDEIRLIDAIKRVHEVAGIKRIRLGSLEPVIVTPSFVDALKQLPKVCPQFHLALQSGSDTVLKRMRRRYSVSEYLASCKLLRNAYPICALTTDVMTGFPGETREEFEQTMDTVRQANFSRIHVFPYSEREGTRAAAMEGAVDRSVREQRARELIALGKELEGGYYAQMIGQVYPVLFEDADEQGLMCGYTQTYVRVHVQDGVCGEVSNVRMTTIASGEMIGQIVSD